MASRKVIILAGTSPPELAVLENGQITNNINSN